MINRLIQRFRRRSYQQLDSRLAYSKWAQDYPPTPHNVLMEIEQQTMLSLMPTLQDKRVLDLACGSGRYALLAQDHDAKFVLGIDDSEAMLRQSTLSAPLLGSMAQIPIADACMDVVICGLAVGHYPKLDDILSEISRILVTDGYAVISDFHPFQYLTGARRTFTSGDTVYEVEHYPHLYQTIVSASQSAGLQIDHVKEPMIDGQSLPVVLVYRLRKV